MKASTKWFALLLAVVTLFSVSCSSAEKDENSWPANETDIIKEMILNYGYRKDSSADRISDLQNDLKEMNSEKAEYIKKVMDYWKYAEDELVVNPNVLPDGLDDSNLCIVVLGFELNADGTMQDELIGRLTVALNSANKYPNALVVCTGGGTAAENNTVTEAGLMGEWLVAHGLDESRLIVEDKSLTTVQNAENTFKILEESYPNVNSIALVSSSYHIPWGALLFECVFMRSEIGDKMHIVSNAGYEIYNEKYADVHKFITGALIDLFVDHDEAMIIYFEDYQPQFHD